MLYLLLVLFLQCNDVAVTASEVSPSPSPTDDEGLTALEITGIVIGAVLGAILVIALILLIILICCCLW